MPDTVIEAVSPPRVMPASLGELFVAFTALAMQGFGGVVAWPSMSCATGAAGSHRPNSWNF